MSVSFNYIQIFPTIGYTGRKNELYVCETYKQQNIGLSGTLFDLVGTILTFLYNFVCHSTIVTWVSILYKILFTCTFRIMR